ncbi:hypothetical protein [Bacteriovorax sp. Seq25_V]|uniref:hypothetical protein n=1 Tax=Bacteriovorax sp. Seq25_V TaxID=1201288 RepID=UPI000389F31B|nr:hypothetical protein [Bacteriovorax sp. Seq25_V]EQC45432.1 hypothetical protein M900_1971 [Bacteriovorax sp. Seq25_V]
MRYLVLFFLSLSVLAGRPTQFSHIHGYVNKECPTWDIKRFERVEKYFYFGVDNAKKYGYTYAFPIERNGVDYIWCALVPERGIKNKACNKKIFRNSQRPFEFLQNSAPDESDVSVSFVNKEEQYNEYLSYVRETLVKEKSEDPNVGAVLEILTRYYLQVLTDTYPAQDYAIESGVEYRYANQRTLGELDIIVYERATCDVVALGESKASSSKNQHNSLMKAKDQLRRIKNFLDENL